MTLEERSMRQLGSFTLNIEPATATTPARVSIRLAGARPDEKGVLHLTPDCMTIDQVEGQINLQDELDALRTEAGRVFAPRGRHKSARPSVLRSESRPLGEPSQRLL